MPSDSKKKSQMLVEELQKRSRKCQEFVRKSFLAERIEHPELQEALKHYFSYWNDYTHPGLFSITCQAVGEQPDRTVQSQAAMAMMAAAFDIHDDIIDKSGAKHGCPTVYGKFGQDISLLLGDAFMIGGFTLLGTSISKLSMERMQEILAIIRRALFEVGNAHALELSLKGKANVSPSIYMRILRMKAASVEADMHVAALICGCTNKDSESLRKYGRILGILATLREEFVDVFEPEELDQRRRNETLPIPILYALQEKSTAKRIEKILMNGQLTQKNVHKLSDEVFCTKSVGNLRREMRNLIQEATSLARQAKKGKPTALLVAIAQSMSEDL